MLRRREEKDGAEHVTSYVDPSLELNLGLWMLFAGATALLLLRVWIKVTRRHGLWYDDYILITSWAVLLTNNALISHQYATGYVTQNGTKWDDRMHILINITSCGTLIGQAWTKTAFGVTLLKLSNKWQQYVIWFCVITMVYNIIMDFVFALLPWIIVWKLNMRRKEKILLCATMSLGMIVAIVAAVRTVWKDSGNKRDPEYYRRNALSNVWFSSEVAGTIMVQCIPVLRSLFHDVSTVANSRRIAAEPHELKPYEPSPLSGWENSKNRDGRALDSAFDEHTVAGFDFDLKRSGATSASEVELVTWNEEKELEKSLYVDGNGRMRMLSTISEKSEEGKRWSNLQK